MRQRTHTHSEEGLQPNGLQPPCQYVPRPRDSEPHRRRRPPHTHPHPTAAMPSRGPGAPRCRSRGQWDKGVCGTLDSCTRTGRGSRHTHRHGKAWPSGHLAFSPPRRARRAHVGNRPRQRAHRLPLYAARRCGVALWRQIEAGDGPRGALAQLSTAVTVESKSRPQSPEHHFCVAQVSPPWPIPNSLPAHPKINRTVHQQAQTKPLAAHAASTAKSPIAPHGTPSPNMQTISNTSLVGCEAASVVVNDEQRTTATSSPQAHPNKRRLTQHEQQRAARLSQRQPKRK